MWEPVLERVEGPGEILTGEMDPRPIVSHRLSLEEAPKGYELFSRREATKVVLLPASEA